MDASAVPTGLVFASILSLLPTGVLLFSHFRILPHSSFHRRAETQRPGAP